MYDEFQTQQFWDNMKKSQLKQLIKEEFNKILNEESETPIEMGDNEEPIEIGDIVKYENQRYEVIDTFVSDPPTVRLKSLKGLPSITVMDNKVVKIPFEDIKFEVEKGLMADYGEDITNNEIDSMNELVGIVALLTDPTGYRMNKDEAEKEAKELIQKYIQ